MADYGKMFVGTGWELTFDPQSPIAQTSTLITEGLANLTNLNRWKTNRQGVYQVYPGMETNVIEYATGSNNIASITTYKYIGAVNSESDIQNINKWSRDGDNTGGLTWKGVIADLTALGAVSNPQDRDYYYVTSEQTLYIYNGALQQFQSTGGNPLAEAAYATEAGSAAKLDNKRLINGLQFDGTSNVNNLFSCTSTPAEQKTVNLTGIGTVENNVQVIPVGTEIRVLFTSSNTVSEPTLNGIPIQRGGEPFNVWSPNTVLHLTYVTIGGQSYWQVAEANNVDAVVGKFDTVDTTVIDFGEFLWGEVKVPVGFNWLDSEQKLALFNMFVNLYGDTSKIHLLKYHNKMHKFDLAAYYVDGNTETLVISFIHHGLGDNDTPMARLIQVSWTYNSDEDTHTFNWEYGDLLAGSKESERLTTLENQIKNLETKQYWYDLDQ